MNSIMTSRSIGLRVFILIVSLFALVIFSFFFLYRSSMNKNKIENINTRLQDYNDRMYEILQLQEKGKDDSLTASLADAGRMAAYMKAHPLKGMRLTLIRPDGTVAYDSWRNNPRQIVNHADRKEVREALSHGKGYDISRASATVSGRFFYSATYYPRDSIVIRTALPFDQDLGKDLSADFLFMCISLAALILVAFLLYRFIHRVNNNVAQLSNFAEKTDRNEPLELEELAKFSDDALGDISEHIVRLYIRLQKTRNEQNILKRQLTQNIAHELKTPIASISGYLETLLESPDMPPETRTRFIKHSYQQCLRLENLVNDISTLNRMDDGLLNIPFTEVDIAEQIHTLANEMGPELEKKHMTLTTDLPADLRIRGNASLIYSIFHNLADNALAYAGEGTSVRITAVRNAAGDAFAFCFSDNGVGVAEQHLDRLFERFYRIDKGRSRKMGGTGLGLSIVKNAVLVHGGEISVSNNPGGGLCFRFTLRIRN